MKLIKSLSIIAIGLSLSNAFAGTQNATVTASGSVEQSCTFINTNQVVNFGTILTGAGPKNANFNVDMKCSDGLPYSFYIDAINGSSSAGEPIFVRFSDSGSGQALGLGTPIGGVGQGDTTISLNLSAVLAGSINTPTGGSTGDPATKSFALPATVNVNATAYVNY